MAVGGGTEGDIKNEGGCGRSNFVWNPKEALKAKKNE